MQIVNLAHDLVIRNISAGIIVLDPSERIVDLNPYARDVVAREPSAAIGAPIRDVLPGWRRLGSEGAADREMAVPGPEGERWFHIQSAPIRAEDGGAAGHAVMLFDVTARRQAERQLEALARTDPLTGVMNRRYFMERAAVELARARRYERPLALMVLDIDHFRAINETYGQPSGDRVLRFMAAECQRFLRTTDLFARIGGEKFGCLLPEGGAEEARSTAERIRQAVAAAEVEVDGDDIRVTVSIGVTALGAGAAATVDQLMHEAERMLYASKSAGRNKVSVSEQGSPAEREDLSRRRAHHDPPPSDRG